ncbi:hypothetical protein ABE530_04075 [Brucella sp. TWI559]
MKIKMLMSIAGAGFALSRGDVTERFSESEAISLINSGSAVPFLGTDYETTVADRLGTETAVAALNLGAAGGGPETGIGAEPGSVVMGAPDGAGTDTSQQSKTAVVTDAQVGENGAAAGSAEPETGASKAETAPAQPASGKAKGKAD